MSKRDSQIPAFLSQTHAMVSDPSSDHVISWTRNGTAFQVHDPIELAKSVLPCHFKHNNFSSFIRQLNMYGIQKFGTNNVWLFGHENFIVDQPALLANIKRKAPTSGTKSKKSTDPALGESIAVDSAASADMKDMVTLLNQQKKTLALELSRLQDSQRGLEKRMAGVQNMNAELWKELVQAKQEQGVMRDNIAKIAGFLRSACDGPQSQQHARVAAADRVAQSPASMTSAMLGSPVPGYAGDQTMPIMGTAQPLGTPVGTAKRSADDAGLYSPTEGEKRANNDESVVPVFDSNPAATVPDAGAYSVSTSTTSTSSELYAPAPPADAAKPDEPAPIAATFDYSDFFSDDIQAQKEAMLGETDESIHGAYELAMFESGAQAQSGEDLVVPDFN